jgi:hypothetical protein
MAKGQTKKKQNKKPKADPNTKGPGSAYKQSQQSGVGVIAETFKKKQ